MEHALEKTGMFVRIFMWVRGMAEAIPFEQAPTRAVRTKVRAERYLGEYGNVILRLAYSYVHNMADAEDILQETLIKVLEADKDFESKSHEKAYLLKAASNLAKNKIAYNRRRETDELSETLAAEEREDLAFVWEAVKSLPAPLRAVIHLFYEEGYRTAEIAKITGRREATVRSDLKRARERLKIILKEEYIS